MRDGTGGQKTRSAASPADAGRTRAAPVPSRLANKPLRGIVLIALAVLCFACMDVMMKYLTQRYEVPLVLGVRYLGNLLLMVAVLGPRLGRELFTARRPAPVLLRGSSLAVASLLAVSANRIMPVAEATAIIYLAPLGVMLLAGPMLGERVGPLGWLAAGMAFLGVLMIVRPGAALPPMGVALALGAAAVTIAYQMMSRTLAASESTGALLFYATIIGTVAFGGSIPWFWSGPPPGAVEIALFVSIGALAGLGHFLLTAAFRYAPASLLAPVTYVHLLWAGLLGWLVFGHVPDGLTILGLLTVAAAGVTITLRSRRRGGDRG